MRAKSTARGEREEKTRGVRNVLISRFVSFAVRTHESNEFSKELQAELNLTNAFRDAPASVTRMEKYKGERRTLKIFCNESIGNCNRNAVLRASSSPHNLRQDL